MMNFTLKQSTRRGLQSLLLISALQFGLSACQTESTDLVDPPKSYNAVETQGGNTVVEFNPKVDILFVIDDSASMKPHQERLVKNIEHFVNAFAEYDVIDFHIGAVTVWDSGRYRTATNPNGVVPEVSSDGFRNFYPIGQLQPEPSTGTSFVSRVEGFTELLRSTLSITPKCHESYRDCVTPLTAEGKKEGRGPEEEELFSPVVAALSEPMAQGANQGFRRDDAHLVLIFITDADDGSLQISASQLDSFLRGLTDSRKEQNFSVYGVIHASNRAETKACPKDPVKKASKIEEFFRLSGAETLDICSNDYGSLLSEIGNKIRRKAFSKVIPLPYRPEYLVTKEEVTVETENGSVTEKRDVIKWIEVVYGKDQILPNDSVKGWTYDTRRNAIIIHEGVELTSEKGAGISIRYTPVQMQGRSGGRVQSFTQTYSSAPKAETAAE